MTLKIATSAEQVLALWRNQLAPGNKSNPLLHCHQEQGTAWRLQKPEASALLHRLVQGESIPESELACASWAEEPQRRLALRLMYLQARLALHHQGIHRLYLACGLLQWRDADNNEVHSPLVLWPVELSRPKLAEFFLSAAADEPLLNPLLTLRLWQDFDFRLPHPPITWTAETLLAYWQEVGALVTGLPGWQMRPEVLLGLWDVGEGFLLNDWEQCASALKNHPLLQILAGEVSAEPLATSLVPQEEDLDAKASPEKTLIVLDADGPQRRGLEAGRRGNNFVMLGPMGTGKRQTIVNLVADCLARGKKILVISPIHADWQAIHQRLQQVGLGEFCLPLSGPSFNSTKGTAALLHGFEQELNQNGEGPSSDYAAPSGIDHAPAEAVEIPFDPAQYVHCREQLNAYLHALHLPRQPLDRTVWTVLGELACRASLPTVPLGMPLQRTGGEETGRLVVAEVTPSWLEEAAQTLQRWQQLFLKGWAGGTSYWVGFKAERYHQQLRDEVLSLLDRLRSRAERVLSVAQEYAAKLGVTGSIGWLRKLGDWLESRPSSLPEAWLRADNLSQLALDLEGCAAQYQQLALGRQPLTARYGPPLWQISPGTARAVAQAWQMASGLLAPTPPAPPSPGGEQGEVGLIKQQQQLRGWAADTLRRLPSWLTEIRTLEKWLAIPLPLGAGSMAQGDNKLDPSLRHLRKIIRLANLCLSETPPERTWVHDPQTIEAVRALIAASRPVLSSLQQHRQHLLQNYTEGLFELDVGRLAQAFAGPYRSWWRFLRGQYRQDYRAIRRRTRSFAVPATVADDLAMAQDLLHVLARLEAEKEQRRQLLGRYEKGADTDLAAAERATAVAAEARELVKELGCSALPGRLVDALCAVGGASDKIRAAVKRLQDSLATWGHSTQDLQTLLPLASLPGCEQPAEECSLSAWLSYAKDLQTSLNQLGRLTDPVLAQAPAPPATMTELMADLEQAEQLLAWEQSQESDFRHWRQRLGPAFAGVSTDWDGLRQTLAWVQGLRELLQAPGATGGSDQLVSLLLSGKDLPSNHDLRHAQEQYQHAWHSWEIRFESGGPMLEGKPLREHPSEKIKEYVLLLRQHIGELAEWTEWRHLPGRLAHLGLSVFLEGLQQAGADKGQAVEIFWKSFWSCWLDLALEQEPILKEFSRSRHEQLLQQFQELDRQSQTWSAQRVLQSARQRRRQALAQAPETERMECLQAAQKNAVPGPLPRWLRRIPHVWPELKPCVLAHPLALGRLLPPAATFDVVVITQADQVPMAQAIPAIVRAKQLVLAADEPPSSTTERGWGERERGKGLALPHEGAAGADTLLDVCRRAGFPKYYLRCHYRNPGEGLIAFVNEHFYDDSLLSFPSAGMGDGNQEIDFIHVAGGLYDSQRRHNLAEAVRVAQVLVQQAQLNQSLAVIAATPEQVVAIEEELERLLAAAPQSVCESVAQAPEPLLIGTAADLYGAERDAVLLSITFGPEEPGKKISAPLLQEMDGRWIHTAITGARKKMIVVSSLLAEDLDQQANQIPAVLVLQHLLAYVQAGRQTTPALAQQQPPALLSRCAAEVMKELQRHGYTVAAQVGDSTFQVDVAVGDPQQPAQFILGILGDGPEYYAVSTASQRHRLLEEALQRRGWRIHHLWSQAFAQHRPEEIARLLAALPKPPEKTNDK